MGAMRNTERKPKKRVNSQEADIHKKKKLKENNSKDDLSHDVNNSNIEESEDEGNGKITTKEIKTFNGKFLRKAFISANGIDTLHKFIIICKENKERDLAAEYLLAGGSILEILRLLDTNEKRNISNATTIFSAVHILIIKILAQYPQYQSNAEEACRHLINSYLSIIHTMLAGQSSPKQKKVVLKLLASIVSLGRTLPRELLVHLSLQQKVLESLIQHTKPSDSQSVRTCFIHFILAFLVEGNAVVIRTLLEKRGLISSIFSDLIYDSKELVTLVLSTVKTYVLENSGISKTAKLSVFSTPVVQNLVTLYNWKGPKNWPKVKSSYAASSAFLAEKDETTNVVHEFLLTLLTSHKHGIIFHDRMLGTSGARSNQLVYAVLQSLDRPWEYEKPSDLVVKILMACPDLIKSQMSSIESYLQPRASKKWIALIKFVKTIIESLNIDNILQSCLLELNAIQLLNVAINLVAPNVIIKSAIIPALNNDHMIVRHKAIELLMIIFTQMNKFVLFVKTCEQKSADFSAFRNQVCDYLIKNIPSLDKMLEVWKEAMNDNKVEKKEEGIPRIEKEDHFDTILNLLNLYSNVCPELLNTSPNVESKILFSALTSLEKSADERFNHLKVKVIRFLLALDPLEFLPKKSIFNDALPFLINLLDKTEVAICQQVKDTIKLLLDGSRMFEGCDDQVDIWINGFYNFKDSDEKNSLILWFVNILKATSKNPDKYVKLIMETDERNTGEQINNMSRINDILDELSSNDRHMQYSNVQPSVSISPLLSCALYKLKMDSSPTIHNYVSYILINTLHYQVIPNPLVCLSKNINDFPANKYLTSWLQNEPISIKKLFSSMSAMCKLSKALISEQNLELNEEKEVLLITSGSKNIKIYFEAYEILSLLRMTIFYLTQFIQGGYLSERKNNSCTIIINGLLKASLSSSNFVFDKCLRCIFTHPIILQNFSVLPQKEEDMKKMMTATILNICKFVIELRKDYNFRELFHPFRYKLLEQLEKLLKKNQIYEEEKEIELFVSFLEVLDLTSDDITNLLTTLIKLDKKRFISKNNSCITIYGFIIFKLINILCMQKAKNNFNNISFDKNFTKKLFSIIIHMKSRTELNFDEWENNLCKYLNVFPYNAKDVDTNIFTNLLSAKMNLSTIKLVSNLCSKNTKYVPAFVKFATNSEEFMKQHSTVFFVIANNLDYKWDYGFLQKLKKYHQENIVNNILNPNDKTWLGEYINGINYLIENTFDFETCQTIFTKISQIGDKLEMLPIQFIQTLESLYKRCKQLQSENQEPAENFIQILVYVTTLTLKKESKNIEKLNILCDILIKAINELKRQDESYIFDKLSSSSFWLQFTRFSLKLSLKETKNESYNLILKLLTKLCDIAYKDDNQDEYVKTLFEMTTSHSEFINIMLSSVRLKRNLVEFLWILIKKNKLNMALSHVPVYLSAYNATLSETDQFILYILQYYEAHSIKINQYRPYLWGSAAAVHYSIKGEIDTALWRQPSTSQVLSLFEIEKVEKTIKNYPVDRKLRNELNNPSDIYDPAFYLPLFCYLLSENNVVACHRVTQSGALALTFAACASSCSELRMAAYTIISRFYFHIEASSSKEKLLWIRIVDALRNGISELKCNLEDTRLNSFLSTFLARLAIVTTQPLHHLYSPLQTFLMAKPALDLNTIPELLQLFHSSDINHIIHRHWILEILRDGMKTVQDSEVALKCVLFKMLLDFYTCVLSDEQTKLLILEVINAAVKIPKMCLLLLRSYGLLPWLTYTVENLNGNTKLMNLTNDILNNILDAISQSKKAINDYKLMVSNILLSLKQSPT
ncbi:nucleolar pre-ribosomal-associated protein 1 isoform X2 [Prorops nasuta]|uniref:nucleolar pre-ribosomal-associated protein 1 isoform X2 n=1 Tax=Prorops nasuta TaxID=863751 RepID=UPI0034CED189